MNDSSNIPQKQCTKCEQWLPATTEFFYMGKKGKLRTQCKTCISASGKIYSDAHVEERKARYQSHREERLAEAARYRETHRDEMRARSKRYQETHRAQMQALQRQYYLAHREEFLSARRDYRKTHREAEIARGRDYYQSHREEYRIKNERYYEINQESIKERRKQDRRDRVTVYRVRDRVKHHKRRASKKNLAGTLTAQQIRDKLKAQKYACYYCFHKFEQRKDKGYVYHLDHVIPLSRIEHNPRHDMNNTVLTCPHCNLSKSNKLPSEWAQGGRLF